MGSTITRNAGATLLVILMAIGSIVMWLVAPVFWLWLASQIASSSQPSIGIYMLVLVGIVASMIVIGKLLGWLNRVHQRLTGRLPARREQTVWLKSMRAERDNTREHGVLGLVMAWSVSVALTLFGVWFFFFAEGGGI
jgi:hypothetical protein